MPQTDFVPTVFQKAITTSMQAWRVAEVDGSRSPMWSEWLDGIHESQRSRAKSYVESTGLKLHDFVAALPSSQVFAFNLFLPFFEAPARDRLSRLLTKVIGHDFQIDRVDLEWVPPGALLGEISGDKPRPGEPATGVDVILWGTSDGVPAAVLIEVKFSEGGFTHCGGAGSSANRRPDVCSSAKTFFDEPTHCYLNRPARAKRERRYWEIYREEYGSVSAAFPGTDPNTCCPFKGEMQQPMRNLAVAIGLKQGETVNRSWFLLCTHDANPDVPVHWAQWQALLSPSTSAPLLFASEVVAVGAEAGLVDWASWMTRRYRLPLSLLRYARAPSANFLRELSAGGGLSFLVKSGKAAGVQLDIHLREQDHLHVYCGLTRIIDVRFAGDRVILTAHSTYRDQAPDLFRTWDASEYPLLEAAIHAYYLRVAVSARFTTKEGGVVTALASAPSLPWIILDREAVIGYASTPMQKAFRAFPAVKRAREQASTVTILADKDSVPAELDALAATPDGSLVLLELKHSQSSSAELTQAPLQLLQYIWEWHTALPTLLPQLGDLLAARRVVGLIPAMESLNGRLSAAIVIDDGSTSQIVEERLLSVLKIANDYLPGGVEPIQLVRISVR
jgi:hypothetical protein